MTWFAQWFTELSRYKVPAPARALRAALYGSTVFLSFFLMLVFMTYNVRSHTRFLWVEDSFDVHPLSFRRISFWLLFSAPDLDISI